MLDGFCRRAVAAGLPIARAGVIIDTLHPVHEGRAFRWHANDGGGADLVEYGPTTDGEAAERWRASAFYHLLDTGGSLLRVPLRGGDTVRFPVYNLASLAAEGMSEYVVVINRFARHGAIGEMDCVYSYW